MNIIIIVSKISTAEILAELYVPLSRSCKINSGLWGGGYSDPVKSQDFGCHLLKQTDPLTLKTDITEILSPLVVYMSFRIPEYL